jgi:tellurite resistance protein TehA-like permease
MILVFGVAGILIFTAWIITKITNKKNKLEDKP